MRYTALTIGPIYEALSLAEKTRGIWAASYMFSNLMRDALNNLEDKSAAISPSVNKLNAKQSAAGLFNDRAFLRGDRAEELKAAYEKARDKLIGMIAAANPNGDRAKIAAFCKRFFTYAIIVKDVADGVNPLLAFNELAAAEQEPSIAQNGEGVNYLLEFFQNINGSKLKEIAYGERSGSFKSLPRIAAHGLINGKEASFDFDDKDIDDTAIYESLQKDKSFRQLYKYIAIVYADGDNMSKTLSALSVEKTTEFSAKLLDFSRRAAERIEGFGGLPVYAGGDDLLFFAPVYSGEKTIFALLEELGADFESATDGKSTLSFGLSISYYKFPLREALEFARNELFVKAKNAKGKNALAFIIQKHSGQSFESVLSKSELSDLIEIAQNETDENTALPRGLHYKLAQHETLINQTPDNRLRALFDNLFNEEIHQTRFKASLDASLSLLIKLRSSDETDATKKLWAILSAVKLLRS
ncbi:MAG: type III-B CRISPR-associated protein Cas10/Cmr2 [Helicobacteraceae bacterium]|jgi:CRISPR-associated protein Cmr2|nr:type III-B CRISPR-associated protein Cas10/Cmr2 [Helicobacteraceae bacterium]